MTRQTLPVTMDCVARKSTLQSCKLSLVRVVACPKCTLALSTPLETMCSRPCCCRNMPGLWRKSSPGMSPLLRSYATVPQPLYGSETCRRYVSLGCKWEMCHSLIELYFDYSIAIMQGSSSLSTFWSSPALSPSRVSSWWPASVPISSVPSFS